MEESIAAEILKKVKSKLYTYLSVLVAIIIVLIGCIWLIATNVNKKPNNDDKKTVNTVEKLND